MRRALAAAAVLTLALAGCEAKAPPGPPQAAAPAPAVVATAPPATSLASEPADAASEIAAPVARALPAEKPLLEASTEFEAPGEVRPPKPLARAVIQQLDKLDIELLDECISEKGLKSGDYAALLSAVRVKPSAGRELWFVRPAHKPYCHALYGAHLFRYYLVERRAGGGMKVVFQNGGDAFTVYPTVSHGLNDIETTGCTAGECWIVRHAYDGKAYQPTRCTHRVLDLGGREVFEPMNCDELG